MPRSNTPTRRLRRLGPAITMSAALAVTLAACSGSGGTAAQTTATNPPAGGSTHASSATTPSAAPATSALSGKWQGQYGGTYQGTFVLHWHQAGTRLNGVIRLSNPGVTVPIHGRVAGGSIRFGTVGSYAITYSGSVSGTSMSGHYQVNNGSGAGGPWSAHKS
jgi:uncharacterized protein YukE